MHVTIIHEPSAPHGDIKLHIWGPGLSGQDVDVAGQDVGAGRFRFEFECDVPDPRDVAFKFRYADGESSTWESDDFEQRVPLTDAQQTIYTLDSTARCLLFDPRHAVVPSIDEVTFQVFTRSRFSGGAIFAWNPAQPDQNARFAETSRDDSRELSSFQFRLQPWMLDGFHFKLVKRINEPNNNYDIWEPDRSNRVWRPADGAEVWLKSGQISMRPQSFGMVRVPIRFVHAAGAAPRLILADVIEDYKPELRPANTVAFRAGSGLELSSDEAEIYPNALYRVYGQDFIREAFASSLRVWMGDPLRALYGISQGSSLSPTRPQRNAQVEVFVEPNPNSAFNGDITFEVYLGSAPSSSALPAWTPYQRVRAAFDATNNRWQVRFRALGDVGQSLRLTDNGAVFEARADGPCNGSEVSPRQRTPKPPTARWMVSRCCWKARPLPIERCASPMCLSPAAAKR